MDEENIKYCGTHGLRLENNICYKCAKEQTEYWEYKYPNEEFNEQLKSAMRGEKSDYLLRRLNEKPFRDHVPWFKQVYRQQNDYPSTYYFCHTCKYYMCHQLIYCALCGQAYQQEKITAAEFEAKYSDYRQGY